MINRGLIGLLQDELKLIDRREVLWWQLGFEGRRIYTEEEFEDNLEEITIEIEYRNPRLERPDPGEETYKLWTKNEVPILIKEFEVDGVKIPFFISVKPISHNWERNFERKQSFPLEVYLSPHIRGIVLETTKNHMFWYPVTFGHEHNVYASQSVKLRQMDLPIITNPISPNKFYKNIIERSSWSHGRRAQKRAKHFDCKKEGFKLVPYYEFDPTKPHMMVYPIPLFEGKLDLPVFVKSRPPNKPPETLGVGYCFALSEDIYYWELDKQKQRKTRDTLKRDLEQNL